MSLLSAAGLANLSGTVNLVFDGQIMPGSLLLTAGSVDQTNTYVFEVVPRSVVESISKSLAYWSIGNGDDTMVTLWNPADEAQDLILQLFFSGGHYLHPIHLGPRASYTFNVSEIVHNQVPDSEGNIIPAGVSEGSAKISGSQAENEHILVAIDAGTYNVRKATCGQVCFSCDGWTSFGISPNSFTVPVGGTQAMQFLVNYDSGFQFNDTLYTDWASNNSSLVSVGVPNTNYDLATGVAAGSTYITANDTYYNPAYIPYQCFPTGMNCPIHVDQLGGEASATVQVPIPVNFRQVGVQDTGNGDLKFNYNWDSSDGNTSDLSQCSVREYVTYPGSGNFNWPSPPYDTSGNPTANPTITNPPIAATDGGFFDNNLHPGFQKPYAANTFTATQKFQFSCSGYQGGAWVDFYGPISLTRTISNVPPWTYTLTKSGSSASVTLP